MYCMRKIMSLIRLCMPRLPRLRINSSTAMFRIYEPLLNVSTINCKYHLLARFTVMQRETLFLSLSLCLSVCLSLSLSLCRVFYSSKRFSSFSISLEISQYGIKQTVSLRKLLFIYAKSTQNENVRHWSEPSHPRLF